MNNKEELLKRKEKLTTELNKIKEELDMFDQETVKVINFRGATVGSSKKDSTYEMFDVLLLLSKSEYEDLENSNKDNILNILINIISNNDYGKKLYNLNIIRNLVDYDVLCYDKGFTCYCYPCELYVMFGYSVKYFSYDYMNVTMQLLDIPLEVYNKFEDVCISRYLLEPYVDNR